LFGFLVFILSAAGLVCQYRFQSDWLERLVPEITCCVLNGMLNSVHPFIRLLLVEYMNLCSLPHAPQRYEIIITAVQLSSLKKLRNITKASLSARPLTEYLPIKL